MNENDRLYKAYEKPKIWNIGKEEAPDWIKDLMPHDEKIKPEGESMNDLERLKKAEEAEPMAVLVKKWAECCGECDEISHQKGFMYICPLVNRLIQDERTKPDDCPLQKAIGIIEPNGHVVFLREEEGQ